MTEYATLAEFKAARRIKDDSDDTALQSVLVAASRAIDRRCGRRFWLDTEPTVRTYRTQGRVVSEPDSERLLVDDIGSLDGLVVEVGSGSSWTPVTDYEPLPDNAPARGEPVTTLLRPYGTWGCQQVRVTAQHGWPAVPDEIRQATLLLASRLYHRKDSPQGITGSADWGPLRVSRMDPDVEALLGPFALPGFA